MSEWRLDTFLERLNAAVTAGFEGDFTAWAEQLHRQSDPGTVQNGILRSLLELDNHWGAGGPEAAKIIATVAEEATDRLLYKSPFIRQRYLYGLRLARLALMRHIREISPIFSANFAPILQYWVPEATQKDLLQDVFADALERNMHAVLPPAMNQGPKDEMCLSLPCRHGLEAINSIIDMPHLWSIFNRNTYSMAFETACESRPLNNQLFAISPQPDAPSCDTSYWLKAPDFCIFDSEPEKIGIETENAELLEAARREGVHHLAQFATAAILPARVILCGSDAFRNAQSVQAIRLPASFETEHYPLVDKAYRSLRIGCNSGFISRDDMRHTVDAASCLARDATAATSEGAKCFLDNVYFERAFFPTPIYERLILISTNAVSSLVDSLPDTSSELLVSTQPDANKASRSDSSYSTQDPRENRGDSGGNGPNMRPSTHYLDLTITGIVEVGETITLSAQILLETAQRYGQFHQPIFFEPKKGPVTFVLSTQGFECLSKTADTILVHEGKNSEMVAFNLRVLSSSSRWITLTLMQAGGQICELTVEESDISKLGKRRALHAPGKADLELFVTEGSEIHGFSPSNVANMSGVNLGKISPSWTHASSRFQSWIMNQYKVDADPHDVEYKLRVIGKELANCLPGELKSIIGSGSIRSILLRTSSSFDFPFEFAYFPDTESGDFFLGDTIPVCRWFLGLRHEAPSGAKVINRIAVLEGKVEEVEKDKEYLRSMFPTLECFRSSAEVRQRVFGTAGFELLHFIGHCGEVQDGVIGLELADGNIELIEIGQLPETSAFGERAPIVTLNGCGTARLHMAMIGKDSFPERFLKTNASAFIGTFWPIDAGIANAVSETFYRQLLHNMSVGEALVEAKRKVISAEMDENGVILSDAAKIARRIGARSYCVFADPGLSVSFETRV